MIDQGVYGYGNVALDFPSEPQGAYSTGNVVLNWPSEFVDQAGYIAGNVTLDVRVAGIGAQALIKGAQARVGGIGAQAIIIDEDDVPDPEAQDTFVIAKPLVVGGKIKQPGDTLTKEQIKTINRFRRYVARGYIVYGGEDGYYATRHMEFRGERIKPGDELDLSDLLYPNPFQRPHRSVLAGDAPDPGDDDD